MGFRSIKTNLGLALLIIILLLYTAAAVKPVPKC